MSFLQRVPRHHPDVVRLGRHANAGLAWMAALLDSPLCRPDWSALITETSIRERAAPMRSCLRSVSVEIGL
jgi:hypothetical protein